MLALFLEERDRLGDSSSPTVIAMGGLSWRALSFLSCFDLL
jgi:hypothetical protein